MNHILIFFVWKFSAYRKSSTRWLGISRPQSISLALCSRSAFHLPQGLALWTHLLFSGLKYSSPRPMSKSATQGLTTVLDQPCFSLKGPLYFLTPAIVCLAHVVGLLFHLCLSECTYHNALCSHYTSNMMQAGLAENGFWYSAILQARNKLIK